MKIKTLIFFVIILNCVFLISAEKYNVLSNETVSLKVGEIAFFESPNYPKFQLLQSFLASNLSFYLETNGVKTVKLVVALTYIYSRTNKALTDIFILNDYFYSVRSLWDTNNNYFVAVQGYVLFEETTTPLCPMESISKDKPFNFFDETYIIYLQSNYQNISDTSSSTFFADNNKKNVPCKWHFTAPKGYGFKIVLTIFEISSMTKFLVKNTTDILINDRSAKVFYPYYNSDSDIEVYLSGDELKFQLYISIVKNNPIIMDGNCTFEEFAYNNSTTILWTSNNFQTQGYQNNIKCIYNFTVKHNTQIHFYGRAALEKYVDTLKYQTGNNEVGTINAVYDYLEILFTPENQYIYFEFISDGSVQDGGFDTSFTTINCQCSSNILECGSSTFISTNAGTPLCSNMLCNFTIKSCETSLTQINIMFTDINNGNNYVCRIYSNDKIVFDINYEIISSVTYKIFVNSTNINLIEIITPKYLSVIYAQISSNPFEPPSIENHIFLSNINSEYVFDLGATKTTAVGLLNAQSNVTMQEKIFIVYGTKLTNFNGPSNNLWPTFYTDNALTSILFTNYNCIIFESTFKCEFKVSSFIIYPGKDLTPSSYLAVKLSGRGEDIKGCVLEENIFIPKNASNFSIVGIATKDGVCKIKLLLSHGYIITSLWTTANEQNVQIFAGNDENLFFEFNSKTMKYWTQIGLFSNLYIVKISNGDSVFLKLTEIPDYPFHKIQSTSFNFHSIVSTPKYGTYKLFITGQYLIYSIGNYPIKITTIYYKMAATDYVNFEDEETGIRYFVNKTGDIMEFKNQIIIFQCGFNESMQTDTGAVFLIENFGT